MRPTLLQPSAIHASITMLVLLGLLLLPLGWEIGPPASANALHNRHAQHTPDSSAPSSACEHFHMCCACLVPAPIMVRLFDAVAVLILLVQFRNASQDTPKPPPRG